MWDASLHHENALLRGQKRVLEMVATGVPLDGILTELAHFIEAQEKGLICAILIVTDDGKHFRRGSGPNLPEAYHAALDGVAIGPPHFSACSEAVYRGIPVIVPDMASDARWSDQWRDLVLSCGLRALRSTPVRGSSGRVLASFAMYYEEPRDPLPADPELIGIATHLAGIAIERSRSQFESQAQLAAELDATRQLQDISTQLIHEQGVEALYDKLVDAAVLTMRADYASMQMLYPERGDAGELQLLASRGFDPTAVKFWQWVRADSGCTCGMALRTGARAIASDVETCEFMAGTDDRQALLEAGMYAAQSTPLVSRSGRLLGMISTHWRKPHTPSESDLWRLDVLARQAADLIERSQTEAALRKSEERLRQIIDSAREYAIITLDRDGRISSWNDGADRLLGYTEDEIVGQPGEIFFTPEDRDAGVPEEEMRKARERGRATNERWHMRKDGSRFWGSGVMLPVNGGEAGSFLKIFRDGTEERLADQQQQLLIDELNHRVKNMLATVQAIATQTLRTDSLEEARENLILRLRALAVGHEVLTQEHWAGADLRQIATNALEPFRTAGEDRVRIGGPSFYLAPQPALALTMALHELATNATKYGALSNETGRLDVSWTVDGDEDGGRPRLRLRWQETGGPPVAEPQSRGFGSQLIERSLGHELGGTVRIDYAPEGVICMFDSLAEELRGAI